MNVGSKQPISFGLQFLEPMIWFLIVAADIQRNKGNLNLFKKILEPYKVKIYLSIFLPCHGFYSVVYH